VFLRYAIEAPTKWANELTLWVGGFVFLCSGFYGMQQRSHIRIFLLYDIVPRWTQRIFDTIWTVLLVIFAIGLVFGSYKQVSNSTIGKCSEPHLTRLFRRRCNQPF